MKSHANLTERLNRQWNNHSLREARLFKPDAWPVTLNIGKPSSTDVTDNIKYVREHLEDWRAVNIGQVFWDDIQYRSASESIEIPTKWIIRNPSEWVNATGNTDTLNEFEAISLIAKKIDPIFLDTLVRQKSLFLDRSTDEAIQACQLAALLEPGHANGNPLRALSVANIDSKFFERHRSLIIRLLDTRFDGLISDSGLEEFLNASDESDHWLLVADLDGEILQFDQIRVRSRDLLNTGFDVKNILLVENDRCLHLLPRLPNTIAILGAGLNLAWLTNDWMTDKNVAYWGDIDTWGLTMLSRARSKQKCITPLLMTEEVFDKYQKQSAITEPSPAETIPQDDLIGTEKLLYKRLLSLEKGRLEQEFISQNDTFQAINKWYSANNTNLS